jgi:uncharacterized protein (DUF983 family)
MTGQSATPPSPYVAGLTGRCPACGTGKLFNGFLRVKDRCEACGLDYAFADSGDGPAVFVILIAGFIVAFAALIVEFAYQRRSGCMRCCGGRSPSSCASCRCGC